MDIKQPFHMKSDENRQTIIRENLVNGNVRCFFLWKTVFPWHPGKGYAYIPEVPTV